MISVQKPEKTSSVLGVNYKKRIENLMNLLNLLFFYAYLGMFYTIIRVLFYSYLCDLLFLHFFVPFGIFPLIKENLLKFCYINYFC